MEKIKKILEWFRCPRFSFNTLIFYCVFNFALLNGHYLTLFLFGFFLYYSIKEDVKFLEETNFRIRDLIDFLKDDSGDVNDKFR